MASEHTDTSTSEAHYAIPGDPRFTSTDRLLAKARREAARTRAERARDEMPDDVYENLLAMARTFC